MVNKWAKRRDNDFKYILYSFLGGRKCNCKGLNCWHEDKCTVTDERCLHFDHINDDGNIDRNKRKIVGSMFLYYYANHEQEAKEKLQVMCANCNWIKRKNKLEII